MVIEPLNPITLMKASDDNRFLMLVRFPFMSQLGQKLLNAPSTIAHYAGSIITEGFAVFDDAAQNFCDRVVDARTVSFRLRRAPLDVLEVARRQAPSILVTSVARREAPSL